MIKLYAFLLATLTYLVADQTPIRGGLYPGDSAPTLRQKRLRLWSGVRDERGSLSTEQVVVTGVLLLLAIGVAGAIKLAVDGRIDAIK